mmetsp:Transcript_9542/g.15414  ORF Transcript_9542/g.15414 Transcript_9542/m.15414 type:complete len:142 (-) Transcript_9542:363-788(-)
MREDPARTLVFMGCLAIASILIIFVQDRHLLAFVGLVEFLKSPLVWWYNKVVRPSLASNMSDPVDLLYSHRPSTKVSNSRCIKKSLNIDQGEDFKGDYNDDDDEEYEGAAAEMPNCVAWQVPICGLWQLFANFLAGIDVER